MIICPKCGTQYGDETLRFCLQDGTPLSPSFPTETPTIVLGETETIIAARGAVPGPKRSNTLAAVVLTALGMLVIFGIAGVGAWLYLRDTPQETAKNNGNSDPSSNVDGRDVNLKTTRAVNGKPTPTPTVNTEELRRDVIKSITTWKSMAESRDLDSYMGNYADTVDYYLKKGASRAFVRGDKQRAFTMFDSIHIDITDMNVTIDPSGENAAAIFDKEWNFEGARRSSGKVRQQLRLKSVNGAWLITAEKDLKVYYSK